MLIYLFIVFFFFKYFRKNWHTWRERFDMKQHRKNIDVIALQFWAYRLQVQVKTMIGRVI